MSPHAVEQRQNLVWIASACRFAEAIAVGMLIPILPVFVEELSSAGPRWLPPFLRDHLFDPETFTPERQTAILFSATGFAMAFIQIVAGRLSDALDRRKPFIIAGMCGAALCSLYFAWLSSYWELLGARIMQGMCLGITFPPLMAILARHSQPGRGGRTLGTYTTIRLFGFASGPVIGGLVSDCWGLGAVFLASALLLAISIAAVSIWIPDYKEENRPRGSDRVRVSVDPMFRVLGSGIAVMMVGISAVISLFPYYRREFGASETELGLCFSAFIGTRCLLQYPMGWLGDRVDKKRVLLTAFSFFVPLVALQGFVTSLPQLVVLRALLGAVSAAISASIVGISADRCQAGNRARVMGINTFSFSMGVAIGPILGGYLTDPHLALAFVIPAAGSLVVMLLIGMLVPADSLSVADSQPAQGEQDQRDVGSGQHIVEENTPTPG